MAEKKKKTTRKTQATKMSTPVASAQFTQLISLAERAVDLLVVIANRGSEGKQEELSPYNFKPPEKTEAKEEKKDAVLINQQGDKVELTFEFVKAEANKLVEKDKDTERKGFYKAREIVLGCGVDRLESVPKEKYPEIVQQFRKAVNEWK